MDHLLDNTVWNALISGNQKLAHGEGNVKFFDREVSPFVGLEQLSRANFQSLYDQITHDRPSLLMSPVAITIPDFWKVLNVIEGFQMVCDNEIETRKDQIKLTPLTEVHVPQMLALTKLTNPGPFAPRTIDFGHYHGIFENDQLVAMAGQRMHPFQYTEISAVCTHPDHLGKGYARQLITHQIGRMKEIGNIPFLQVRHDNTRAIDVYKSLGFTIRTDVYFYVLAKTDIEVANLI